MQQKVKCVQVTLGLFKPRFDEFDMQIAEAITVQALEQCFKDQQIKEKLKAVGDFGDLAVSLR